MIEESTSFSEGRSDCSNPRSHFILVFVFPEFEALYRNVKAREISVRSKEGERGIQCASKPRQDP